MHVLRFQMDLQQILLNELDFLGNPNLDTTPTWSRYRKLPYVDAAYSIENTRVAYFSKLSEADPDKLLKMYKAVWNESLVPLLGVVIYMHMRRLILVQTGSPYAEYSALPPRPHPVPEFRDEREHRHAFSPLPLA